MKLCLTMDNNVRPGFMIPVPQYPLYSACTAEFNAELVSLFDILRIQKLLCLSTSLLRFSTVHDGVGSMLIRTFIIINVYESIKCSILCYE